MSKVLFELSNGVDGEITLRDNDFMEFWKFVFKRNNKLLGPRQDKITSSSFVDVDTTESQKYIHMSWEDNKAIRKDYVELVNDAIDKIIDLGLDWTCGKASVNSHNQDCNRIHRGFTTYMLSRTTDDLGLSKDQMIQLKHGMHNLNHTDAIYLLNHIVNDFVFADFNSLEFELYQQAIPYLHTVNAYIHKIEDTSIASDRSYLIASYHLQNQNRHAGWWPNLDWNSKGADGCTDTTRIDFNFADVRTQDISIYSSDPQYNVYDLKNILGKSYETAWLNYDNPLNWDVTNTFNTTKGGFEIKPYQSEWTRNFIRPWAHEFDMPVEDHIIAPISIGTIDVKWLHQHCYTDNINDLESMNQTSIVKVDLVE